MAETFEELMAAVLVILPEAQIDQDNDGQYVIYTNLRDSDGTGTVPLGKLEPLPEVDG